MSNTQNPPAFPVSQDPKEGMSSGMTLRDYFAAKAMQGIIASEKSFIDQNGILCDKPADMAKMSFVIADCMLSARLHLPTEESKK